MKMKSAHLLDELDTMTRKHLDWMRELKANSHEELNRKANERSWSALECVEHLSTYGDYYTPEIGRRIDQTRRKAHPEFKSGWLGNYFVEVIKPKPGMKKMKAKPKHDPTGSNLDAQTLDRFINHLEALRTLIRTARQTDLTRVRTGISISNWITIRLGDTLRFVVHHNERHLLQAQRAVGQTA